MDGHSEEDDMKDEERAHLFPFLHTFACSNGEQNIPHRGRMDANTKEDENFDRGSTEKGPTQPRLGK